MMAKISLSRPALVCFYGFPGSGKTYLARNLENTLQAARVSADRIRYELFKHPRYDQQENAIVSHLMNYMTDEFLAAGVSVIYDTNAARKLQRQRLRELAQKHNAHFLLVWLQTEPDYAFGRTQNRDKRTLDDRYSEVQTKSSFDKQSTLMQNPIDEDYLVVSGKHSFTTQKNAILTRLYNLGLISAATIQRAVAKPELMNLVPSLQTDETKRSISVF